MTNHEHHITSKCKVCTINYMEKDGWCSKKCALRDYLLKNDNVYKLESKSLTVYTDRFMDKLVNN